jgi:hypothetical protein
MMSHQNYWVIDRSRRCDDVTSKLSLVGDLGVNRYLRQPVPVGDLNVDRYVRQPVPADDLNWYSSVTSMDRYLKY